MPASDRLELLAPRLDLGARALAPGWRALLSRTGLGRDVEQGLVLATVMLPFSLLLSALSGAPASSGVISTAVGSAVCVFFGGTRVAVSGPGLASALVVSSVVASHGVRGLGFVVVLTGALQVLTGVLGFGRFVRLLPLAVIRGTVVGVGGMILFAQLPHAVGAIIDSDASRLERLDRLGVHLPHADPIVLAIALGCAALAGLGLLSRRIPGALLGIVIATVCVLVLGLDVPTLTETEHLPMPQLPALPSTGFATLFGAAIELWGTCALGTLVNTEALQRIGVRKTDPDQELIGQGLATILIAFLGGLPTTQLVARSAMAVRLGVESRRASLVHAVVVLLVGLAAWPIMRFVPLASLTGIALVAAVPLLDPRPLRDLWRVSRLELAVGVASIVTILFGGMVVGIIVGLGLSFAIATFRLSRTRAMLHKSKDASSPHQLSFSGPLTFLASLEMERLRAQLAGLDASFGLLVDLRSVVALDATGTLALVDVLDDVRSRGGKVALLGPSVAVRERIQRADEQARSVEGITPGSLADAIAPNDREVDRILGKQRSFFSRPQLLAGLARFREEMREHYDSLFADLADGQHPHTMFITCADSRIDPSLLMGSHPGDLFIVRAIGALIAPFGRDAMPQEGAAVEYGIGVLGVRNIVVCGHSKCGAISALKKGKVPHELATLEAWSKHAAIVAGDVSSFAEADDATRAVTVRQLENLMTYPIVREKHAKGELQIHAWFYDLGEVELFEWDEVRQKYGVLGHEPRPTSLPPPPPPADATVPEASTAE